MTDIERLTNVSTYFSDNGNNSSWIDYFVCIVFCVFVIFPVDAKYLTNGYRYGHSYYSGRIGNCTHAFE